MVIVVAASVSNIVSSDTANIGTFQRYIPLLEAISKYFNIKLL